MRTVAVAGHLCLDLTPGLPGAATLDPGRLFEVESLQVSLGGCVANTGGDLADLGLPVRLIAAVGDDDLGELVRLSAAARPNISSNFRIVPGASTSYSLVLQPPHTDRTFWHHVGANAHFDGTEIDGLFELDLLHLGYPSLLPALLSNSGRPLAGLLRKARGAGVTTSIDLAVIDPQAASGALDWTAILQRALEHTDIITPSLDDLTSALHLNQPPSAELVARLADTLIDWGAAVVAISAGTRGLYLRTAPTSRLRDAGRSLAKIADDWADVRLLVPPLPVSAVATTNGAGDAGTAGLLYAIAAGAGPAQAAALSTTCAAAVVGGHRTTPAAISRLRPSLTDLVPVNATV